MSTFERDVTVNISCIVRWSIYRVRQKSIPRITDVILWPPIDFCAFKTVQKFTYFKMMSTPAFCLLTSAFFPKRNVRLIFFAMFQSKVLTMSPNRSNWSAPMLCSVGSKFTTWNVCSSRTRRTSILNPPVSNQNRRVWATGKKADVKPPRLLVQRKKFAQHVMVSAGVNFSGKCRLHFVNSSSSSNTLLTKLQNAFWHTINVGYRTHQMKTINVVKTIVKMHSNTTF